MKKPKVFIGSSSEALPIAKALELNLSSCDIYLWNSGVFDLSQSALEDLENKASLYEYAILVLAPDDWVCTRGNEFRAPRDNVLFELGLFMGRLGRRRTFVVCDPAKVKLPTDWNGITVARFDWERAISRNEAREALSPTCTEILDAIRSVPPKDTLATGSTQTLFHVPGEDELYDLIVGASANRTGVIVLNTSTEWAWKLFPTILTWRLRQVPLTLILTPARGSDKNRRQENYRRNLLRNLGAKVVEQEDLPFRAFLLDSGDEDNLEVLVLSDDTTGCQSFALRYHASEHREAAVALFRSLKNIIPVVIPEYKPKIVPVNEQEIIITLKQGVSQYRSDSVKIESTTVPTDNLYVISKFTRAYKYKQLSYLNCLYKEAALTPFQAFKVILADGTYTIATPPVVEETSEGLVAIEGNTRATFFLQNKITDFPCLLVRGVGEPLPSTPFPISEVRISERTLLPSQRMNQFNYGNFRHVERVIHPY